jgi:hypothetical protein
MALGNKGGNTIIRRRALIGVMVLCALALSFIGVVAGEPSPIGSVESVFTVPMPGVSSESNNIIDTPVGVLVAPFAPFGLAVEDLEDQEFFKLNKLDNHFLYLINRNDPLAAPKALDLGCYWPTKLQFDEATRTAFVRGTVYVTDEEGAPQPAEVIAYIHINDRGDFDPTVVTIPIKAVGDVDPTSLLVSRTEYKWASSAPDDFVLGRKGRYLVFTNGAAVYSFSTVEGYITETQLIPAGDYSLDNSITHLDINEESNTVIVGVSQKVLKKGTWRHSSDLYFFRLEENGTLSLINKTGRELLPDKTALAPGSNIVTSVKAEDGTPEFAFFILNDGTLFRASISGDAAVKPVASFPELSAGDGETRVPRAVSYDQLSKSIGIVQRGVRLNVSRPLWGRKGKRGKVARSFALNQVVESPVVAVARLGKNGKVASSTVIVDFGSAETSISNLVFDGDGRGLFAGSTGKLFSVDIASGALSYYAELGAALDSIAYDPEGQVLTGIRSFVVDEGFGDFISVHDGAVVIAQLGPREIAGERLTSIVASPGVFGRLVASLRRPYGFRGQ